VEKDLRITGLLKTALLAKGVSNVVVIEKDILKIDIGEFAKTPGGRKIVVLGNLPYNISSPVLIMLIGFRRFISRCVLMFQKELAQRIVSSPGSRDYGRLSVVTQYCADVKAIFEVPSSAFYPKVKVDSTVLEIVFNEKNPLTGANEEKLFKVVKAAFGKRRKNLKNALSGSELKIPADKARSALLQAGIDPIRRAETLSVDEFIRLSASI
jgi:16S rRNA (adenine1518-N6/adenine1519-N6)-dimethyltransferase